MSSARAVAVDAPVDVAVDVAVDLGKSRCRVITEGYTADGIGAPGLAAHDGVGAALRAILPLLPALPELRGDVTAPHTIGVGAAGAWFAPAAAQQLATELAAQTGARVAVTSDVVTAHAGALDGAEGVLLIAGTGAVALGIASDGARLIDGWGPELGDFGSGSWLGREALRAALRSTAGLAPESVLVTALEHAVGPLSGIQDWLARPEPLARRLAALAPLVLEAADAGDPVATAITADAVRLLIDSVVAASTTDAAAATTTAAHTHDVVLHGGLTDHPGFRAALVAALEAAGRRTIPATGTALDGALMLARRSDLPHERFVHRAE